VGFQVTMGEDNPMVILLQLLRLEHSLFVFDFGSKRTR
jgi:hypothetical protein